MRKEKWKEHIRILLCNLGEYKMSAERKVLFHINEPENWKKVITNVKNFIKDVGVGGAEIEVLANGNAVIILKDKNEYEEVLDQLAEITDKKVKVVVCNNALNAHEIHKEVLPAFVEVVPAGITEIVKRQNEGYAYIKP